MDTTTNMTNISATVAPAPVVPSAPVQETQKAVGFWAFVGLIVLFAIPVIGLIANIVFACGAYKNQSITNFARAYLVVTLVGCILSVVLGTVLVVAVVQWATGLVAAIEVMTTDIQGYLDQFANGEITEEQLTALLMPHIETFVEEKLGGLVTEEQLAGYLEEYLGQELGNFGEQFGDINTDDLGDVDVDLNQEDVSDLLSGVEDLLGNAA